MVVYPACAGIDPRAIIKSSQGTSLPRMRGDRPCLASFSVHPLTFTPHARGSTVLKDEPKLRLTVYPACAGIDLSAVNPLALQLGLPRMRGDRPSSTWEKKRLEMFTPHARGSTRSRPR